MVAKANNIRLITVDELKESLKLELEELALLQKNKAKKSEINKQQKAIEHCKDKIGYMLTNPRIEYNLSEKLRISNRIKLHKDLIDCNFLKGEYYPSMYARKIKAEYYKNVFDIPKAQKSINFFNSLLVEN